MLVVLTLALPVLAQSPTELAQPIVEEGKQIYRSEKASWIGTDLFIAEYPEEKRGNIGGYFSYPDGTATRCIFFSRSEVPVVLGTITFQEGFKVEEAVLDMEPRAFTAVEQDYHELRTVAMDLVRRDTFFLEYDNTSPNLVPLISAEARKVYVLTGPSVAGVMLFGNDYLMEYDEDNNLKSKKRLHNNLIVIPTQPDEEAEQTSHTHLPATGDFITATDIATLMLYTDYASWKQHIVISAQYMNMWNMSDNTITVVPMETIRKIKEHQETKKNDQNEDDDDDN